MTVPDPAFQTASAGPAAPVLSLRGITKHYPGVVANDSIDLDFYAGEVHVLLGENGAGKSTLIAILSGMAQPDMGEILIDGQGVSLNAPAEALARGIGTVYQHPTLVPSMTVLQNLMLGGRWNQKVDRAAALARFTQLSELLGISIRPDAVVSGLSLGEQQYVEIVKALWEQRRILILDESTVMLTPKGIEDLTAVISRLQASGLSVIFITHKLSDAVTLGDRISIIKRGRNVGSILPAELKSSAPDEAISRIVEMMFGRAENATEHILPAETRGAPILQVSDLVVRRRADEMGVERIAFTVHAGEVFGIAGVEGNGQKPLAEALAGQRSILEGRILLEGKDITALGVRARQRAGLRYVTDDRLGEGTVGDFGVGANLLMKRVGDEQFWALGFERRDRIAAYSEKKISEFDVRTPSIAHRVASMSGGNIQKLLLARELAGQPRLVIFNKPTYGLDRNNIAAAHRAILKQAQSGLGTIVISTDLDEILALSHRIAVMLRGQIVGVVKNGPEARSQVGELMIGHGAERAVGGDAAAANERVA